MRIVGIDPGTAKLGYAILDFNSKENNYLLIDCGIIETSKDLDDATRLQESRSDLKDIIDQYRPEVMAVEKIFFFKNPKTIVPVAQARGVVLELAASSNLKIFEYTPLEMKKVITGNGMADKASVSEIIHKFLNLKSTIKPDDAVDAVGIAITCIRSDLFNLQKLMVQK